jgi:hypothetical protein
MYVRCENAAASNGQTRNVFVDEDANPVFDDAPVFDEDPVYDEDSVLDEEPV